MRAVTLAVAIGITTAASAAAEPITYRFSSIVGESFEEPAIGFTASPGDRFSAVLTLPSRPSDTAPSPSHGQFTLENAYFDLRVGSDGISRGGSGFAQVVREQGFHVVRFGLNFPSRFTDEFGITPLLFAQLWFGNDNHLFLSSDALPS